MLNNPEGFKAFLITNMSMSDRLANVLLQSEVNGTEVSICKLADFSKSSLVGQKILQVYLFLPELPFLSAPISAFKNTGVSSIFARVRLLASI